VEHMRPVQLVRQLAVRGIQTIRHAAQLYRVR
jgi:hypothetical protein